VPDLVITVGRVGLSRAVLRTVARAGLHVAVDTRPRWSDPTRTADLVVTSVPLLPHEADADPDWLASWQRADVLAAAAVETALAGVPFTGIQVARVVTSAVPDGGLLFVGASWPVRHVAAFAATSAPDALVLGNRGTSGIDGCLSTAWGAAAALQRGGGAGAIALVGDHTFLYDSNALLVPGEDERPDLVYVVADNDGGGIFASLEQGGPAFTETFDRVFGVPLGVDLPALCAAVGVPVALVESAEALGAALDDALGAGGVRVVVARTSARREEARVLAEVQSAVGAALATG
jgi:2-succinyl-5-enolpyruvyl-6-hydroxy-3-cyclohexene-1-carboxylate synthase